MADSENQICVGMYFSASVNVMLTTWAQKFVAIRLSIWNEGLQNTWWPVPVSPLL